MMFVEVRKFAHSLPRTQSLVQTSEIWTPGNVEITQHHITFQRILFLSMYET